MAYSLDNNLPPAVVVGLNDAASLIILRSLGRKGVRIIGLCEDRVHRYYASSKYCSLRLNKPLYDRPLIDALLEDIPSKLTGRAVLFCTTDRSVITVSQYQQELRSVYDFVIPPYDTVQSQISKKGFHQFATQNAFLVPNTFFSSTQQEILNLAEKITFPCVVKPEFRDEVWYKRVPSKVLHVESKADFLSLTEKYRIRGTSLVIQEWVDGDDSDVYFCLAYIDRSHKPLAICTGRKLRQHPHLTGSTSVAETLALPELEGESLRLLLSAGCIGFCSVEFKRSRENGKFYITEPTIGRPDTQEGISVAAGIDIPYIAYRDALGDNVSPCRGFRPGIRWINEPLAFYSFRNVFRDKLKIREIVPLYKGNRGYALWASDDPLPAINFVLEKLGRVGRKLFRLTPTR